MAAKYATVTRFKILVGLTSLMALTMGMEGCDRSAYEHGREFRHQRLPISQCETVGAAEADRRGVSKSDPRVQRLIDICEQGYNDAADGTDQPDYTMFPN